MAIHASAIIDSGAEVAAGAEVGAFALIGSGARIGAGCVVAPHAQIVGRVEIGAGTTVGRGAVIGDDPQDISFDAKTPSGVRIGEGNVIREHVTIHRSSRAGGFTEVGDRNYLMVGAHLGHDVRVGCDTIIANACLVAGFVAIGDRCFLGGGAVFHQFIRIGDLAMVQGNGSFSKDIPPYAAAMRINRITGLNVVGLRRAGISRDDRVELKALFAALFRGSRSLRAAAAEARSTARSAAGIHLLDFIEGETSKGVCGMAEP